jgi:nucleoside-diphosphate-sugar epimerase
MDFFLKNNAYDITKARRELGFYPQVDLLSGLQKTWRWLEGSEVSELSIKAKTHG